LNGAAERVRRAAQAHHELDKWRREFYALRKAVTARLIDGCGFVAVAAGS
jgi:erythromycin esterase-like protein